MKYDYLVFIGRFQPFHCGHKAVVDRALQLADKVLLLVGGANQPRSTRNPWTFKERVEMIRSVYPNERQLLIAPIKDHTYNDEAWVREVQETVDTTAVLDGNPGWSDYRTSNKAKVGLIGCSKDGTSYYLKLFPTFGSEDVEFVNPINATDIRNHLFDPESAWQEHEVRDNVLPAAIAKKLFGDDKLMPADEWTKLEQAYETIQLYREVWGSGPFLTADSLVECGGHILVVERGGEFGQGLIALPGGFVGGDETFKHAAIRELREETKLKVPEPVLKGSIVNSEVFDSPHRSERGRIVTNCYHIKLENETELPKVKGSDDAAKAFWLPISKIASTQFFEDHGFIINKMLGL